MQQTTVRAVKTQERLELLTRVDARGHYTIGKEMVDSVIDRIRRVAGEQAPHAH